MDTKGRARRLPVKADIQKSLCFLGGSTLMVCHVMKECLADEDNTTKCLPSQFHQNSFTPAIAEDEQLKISGKLHADLKFLDKCFRRTTTGKSQHKSLVKDESSEEYDKLSGSAYISISHISTCEYIIYNLNDFLSVYEKR